VSIPYLIHTLTESLSSSTDACLTWMRRVHRSLFFVLCVRIACVGLWAIVLGLSLVLERDYELA
jgi:hypothetical protein